ncbi:hypothetical protein CI109_106489 [Kwoniella shandongensis]|uniref:Uncharacterized protein n=1 Tax=Kwoniella shandongensis TaxID=1734106 RepID=A0A5M6C1M5_9TREE|nr:uncharacterized protein CI109_002671 [Kwoniella shandongensis]KAA5528914.1 hypothetical protein CI109_002671 [Kwoniella shandongensis]
MEASSSTQPPATPSHPSLLPALSPSASIEQTPAPLHTLPPHLHTQPPPPQPRLGNMHPPSQGNGTHQPPPHPSHQMQGHLQQQHQNVFGTVMGTAPGHGPAPTNQTGGPALAKVYASVYSGIPVFEAMIRGISVMRRTSDSWVNATQILKVAGIHKSARTKILEKEILPGIHEKVQGGYGKYQGTWIPFERGTELAAQYGVTGYLAPIFDFVPSPTAVAALPVIRTGTPDRAGQKTPAASGMTGYNPGLMSAGRPTPSGSGRVISPYPGHGQQLAPPPPPPQFTTNHNGDAQMMGIPPHPSAMAYPGQHQQQQQMMYYSPQPHQQQQMMYPGQQPDNKRGIAMAMTPSLSGDGGALAPAANINGIGLPPSGQDVYIDQYGQPHPTFQASAYTNDTDMGPPPAKRQRSDEQRYVNGNGQDEEQQEQAQQQEEDSDDESADDLRDAPPLPTAMRLANKPLRPRPNANTSRIRSKLLSLFSAENHVDVRALFGLTADQPIDFDVDMVIDNQGHTALHWACALAKLSVIAQLIDLGADIHRGNYAGETPLIRSVLTTNHSEAGTFPQLLEYLSPSIRTLDHAYRTVVHHIALIAGVKGRAGSARSYMANVLEWVAREQQAASTTASTTGEPLDGASSNGGTNASAVSLKTLVDVQDVHGDTALNVAARVGNRGLVNLLLDAGADKGKANKLGLKPVDFGLDIEALKVSPAETVISSLKSEVPKPERKSRDVQKNIGAIFETITDTFSNEMLAKQTKLNATEASVRHATRALADKRQQLHRAQERLGEMELLEQRAENVRRVLGKLSSQQEVGDEWTGRSQLSTETQFGKLPPTAFRSVPQASSSTSDIKVEDQSGLGVGGEEIPLPERGSEGSLLILRRMAIWEDRIAEILEDRVRVMEGEGADKAVRYRRLVSLCTKVPVDKVDGMLDGLVTAIESDGQSIDLSRISNFMSRMKEARA